MTETPDDLKAELKDRLIWLCSIFGQPSDLPRFLDHAEWRRLRIWVRALEALAARLVRALAAALSATAAVGRLAQAPAHRPSRRLAPSTEYPDSAFWTGVRVRFLDAPRATDRAGAPEAAGARRARPAQAEAPRGLRSARGLALRLEAVIRVAENAGRYAQRYARRPARRRARPKPEERGRIAAPAPESARVGAPGSPPSPPVIGTG